jgi:beta-N-acetylglucosaminidase
MNIYRQLKNVYGINALDNSTISQGSEKGQAVSSVMHITMATHSGGTAMTTYLHDAEGDYFGRHYAMWSNN